MISIVLVEPQGALNIGAVCRVMMNFGLHDLRLVNPCRGYLGAEARQMAVRAKQILTRAKVFKDLKTAISDSHIALGTTRRFGRHRDEFLDPEQAAHRIAMLPESMCAALVFGREDTGLFTRELDLCQLFVTIPTSEQMPSMNLSHAVAVCLYELKKAAGDGGYPDGSDKIPASVADLQNLFDHMRKTLHEIGFLDPQNPDHTLRTFRRMFGRIGLCNRDVRILHGLMGRIDALEEECRQLRQYRNG